MPKLSIFTPMPLRMSSASTYVRKWYKLLPTLWGTQLDFTVVPSYNESKLYAVARMCALMQSELEHAGNQAVPLKCYDLLPLQELDYGIIPSPTANVVQRQAELQIATQLTQGGIASVVVQLLKSIAGSSFLSLFSGPLNTDIPPQTSVYPSSPGSGPGAFKDVRVTPKLLQLVDPVVQTGSQWVAYQALDTSAVPNVNWSTGASFSSATQSAAGQTVLPTDVNATGFYYTCTTGGITGTTEPTWPTSIGGTIYDGTVTWACTATIAPALIVGDVVVVDPGNTSQMEKLTVTSVSQTSPVGSQTTPGFLYFQASFANAHGVGAAVTTGNAPYWWSDQRLSYVVLNSSSATNQSVRTAINTLLSKVLRSVDTWAIVQPFSTTQTGGVVGPMYVGAPMGCVPVGQNNFQNST